MPFNIHNKKILKARRKQLRNNATSAESLLWRALKNKQAGGRKFRRQQSIGNFIVDFFCYEESLALEIDGGIHNDPVRQINDVMKDEFLISKGFRVLRIKNEDVFNNIELVVERIKQQYTTPNPF